ncbi:LacI family DNA-binding transcriptional regulator [uncultured Martelella sp.]|uniref:LacI family DNA-binding transcriptional regulator n=1 Tax=uncultured Martelella sp. TaxID=392331 RepID=UPI0029C7B872|nr:LacI family DNA-binding transcriptional regulator [uncultured Martelella sp.]
MPKPKKKTTIRDLAEAAETSVSTVSFVLNGTWKKHRTNPETAERVLALAAKLGYQANQRARALRLGRSSLAGMIIPHHRNRFFAGLVENFETEARARGLVPIVVSTQRDPEIERQVAAKLVMQEVELLVVAGVENPSGINRLCRNKGVRCVNVDLPGPDAFSVVTDNFGGARDLTRRLLEDLAPTARAIFLGGREHEYATDRRIEGFLAGMQENNRTAGNEDIVRCGYSPVAAREALSKLFDDTKSPPLALLINSITTFEGFATFWRDRPDLAGNIRVACFDWDPFAACLPVKSIMLRQDVENLIKVCFSWFDGEDERAGEVSVVPPRLIIDAPGPEYE